MCILSAHGLVSTVALYQSGSIVLREVVLFTYVFIRIHSITMYLIMRNFLCTKLIGR